MGSLASDVRYPDASDPSLVLTHPTAAEKEQTWRLNHREWGGALDLSAYLEREPFLASTPLADDGGMVHWILTEADSRDGEEGRQRNVLASCETIRKRVLYALPRDGEVREGFGYGVGSVYTYPEFRGRKYAARMLREVGTLLRMWPEEERLRKKRAHIRGQDHDHDQNHSGTNGGVNGSRTNGHAKIHKADAEEAVCSALWSDIGKRFYASKGWPAFASEHVEFPATSSSSPIGVPSLLEQSAQPHGTSLTLSPVNMTNIADLCREDEAQLCRELARHARDTRRTAFAFAPDPDVFRWHWAREEFIVPHVFPERRASEVRGMIATVTTKPETAPAPLSDGAPGHEKEANGESTAETARMWAVWTHNFGENAASDAAKNTLYILRLVIDEKSSNSNGSQGQKSDNKTLQLAFDAIINSALDAARSWNCGAVHLWNPTTMVRGLVAASQIKHAVVDREVDSIPSMMWYGPTAAGGEKNEEGCGEDEHSQQQAVDWIANEKYCWC